MSKPMLKMPPSCSDKIQRELIRIPARFADAMPKDIINPKLRALVLRYLREWPTVGAKGWGIAIGGPNGTGKSWALASVLHYLVAGGFCRSALFVLAEEFFRMANPMAEANLGDLAFTGDELWKDYYMRVPVLGICDLGKEDRRGRMEDTAALILGTVIRQRVQRGLVTCFDTNLSLAAQGDSTVREFYNEDVYDLLQESTVFIRVTGDSLRKKKQAAMRRRLEK